METERAALKDPPMTRTMTPLSLAALAAACGGQTFEEMPGWCTEERAEIDLDAVAGELTFSPSEVVATWAGERVAALAWSDGAVSTLTTTLDGSADSAVFVDGMPLEGSDPEATCPDALELSVLWTLTSDDGRLAEPLTATLWAGTLDGASLSSTFEALDGELDLTELGLSPEGLSFTASAWLTPEGADGQLAAHTDPSASADESVYEILGTWTEGAAR